MRPLTKDLFCDVIMLHFGLSRTYGGHIPWNRQFLTVDSLTEKGGVKQFKLPSDSLRFQLMETV